MDFISQVKKLKEITKSPEIRQICEKYLNGSNEISESEVIAAIKEQETSTEDPSSIKNHWDSINQEQMEASKRAAASIMESWGGIGETRSKNSGSYTAKVEEVQGDSSLLESIENLSANDASAISFVEAQNLKNLGVLESIRTIENSSIYEYPKVRILCEQYKNILINKGIPEFSVIGGFVADLHSYKWDSSISGIVENLSSKIDQYSREIEVSKVLELIKQSGSKDFYSELSESLNNWLISENKSSGLLSKEISKWSFNPVVRNLLNYLNLNESKNPNKLEIPLNNQSESRVSRVYSPILIEGERTIFLINNTLFEATGTEFKKIGQNSMSTIPSDYLSLVTSASKSYVKIDENGMYVSLGRKTISMVEENEEVSVYLGKNKLNFRNTAELAKILSLEYSRYLGVSEAEVVTDIVNLYSNFHNIVELDFAKTITSNIYEGVCVNLIKWNNQIYLHRMNEAMRENSVYKVNGSQAVKMVKDYLKYDISEGLTEFLDGEQKLKSIMINDRNKVLENISSVETQINKLESVMGNNPEYSSKKEIVSAYDLLNKELSVLKEKWNQINIELDKIENDFSSQGEDLMEYEKFNIGDYIKVKESGETGKIISVDGTSGRYTVLLDNGKTSDFLVNEIVDLEEALKRASEDNQESDSGEDEEAEEMKESNVFNKSEMTEEKQKEILKTLANSHGFAKAPNDENDGIEMELDKVHGYNLTMNEASAKKEPKGNDTYAKAPGNDKMEKSKIEGEDLMDDKAPETKKKTEFKGKDSEGKEKYEIGYNIREGADFSSDPKSLMNIAETPSTGTSAKETGNEVNKDNGMVSAPTSGKSPKMTSYVKSLDDFMKMRSLAKTKNGVNFKANSDMGYNLDESDDLKKN